MTAATAPGPRTADAAPLWTAGEIVAATGGVAGGAFAAGGVAIDSRAVAPGDLFIAMPGTVADGHAFVAGALAAGAAGAVIARLPDGVDPARTIRVADVPQALRALGAAARARTAARVVAVTGSVGKTGTKEMLRTVLGACGPVHASAASFNNHVGVPLSLARMPAHTRYGVFELGMNHAGELADLSPQVRPHAAIVTRIEAVHLAHFGSVEAIADAKAEVFGGLEPGGTAILNRDDPWFDRLARHARDHGADVVAFGLGAGADVRAVDVRADADGSDVTASVAGRAVRWRLGVPGSHWVANSLAVIAAAHVLGADIAAAAAALAGFGAPAGRGLRRDLPWGDGTLRLIDEAYNASPASTRAALAVLGAQVPGPGGRRVAVLGDMLELGDAAADLHAGLADAVRDAGVGVCLLAGSLMQHLATALASDIAVIHAPDSAALASRVVESVRTGDVVMVKGSNGSRMARIVEALIASSATQARRDGEI